MKAGAGSPDAATAKTFAKVRADVPRTLPAGAATLAASDGRLTLTAHVADLGADEIRAVEFFPSDSLVLDTSKPASLDGREGTKVRVRLVPHARRKEPVARLTGVLTITTASKALAFDIDTAPPQEKPR